MGGCILTWSHWYHRLQTTFGPSLDACYWCRELRGLHEDALWPAATCPFNAPHISFLPLPPTYSYPRQASVIDIRYHGRFGRDCDRMVSSLKFLGSVSRSRDGGGDGTRRTVGEEPSYAQPPITRRRQCVLNIDQALVDRLITWT